jgi:hypothetical protein
VGTIFVSCFFETDVTAYFGDRHVKSKV